MTVPTLRRKSGKATRAQRARRARFNAALDLEGVTLKEWCAKQRNARTGRVGISPFHVHLVLRGDRKSGPVDTAVDALIARHLDQHMADTPRVRRAVVARAGAA